MNLSEKTAREISRYVVKLVRRLPYWAKKLFDDDMVCFCVEDDGSLALSVVENMPDWQKRAVRKAVAKYMKTHPCIAIGEVNAD